MNTRIRTLSILTALALAFAASSAWAEEGIVREDTARALQRAESLIQQKQYRKAAAEFERANELTGGSCPDCLLGVARAYSGAGQVDAAIQVTRMALPLFPSSDRQAQAYSQLGSLLTLKGDMDSARAAFQKAVELDGSLELQVRSTMAEALLKRASAVEAASRTAAPGETESFAAAAPQLQ
ncbi:MAG TPA: tetratricopeptide repeat protein [Thermoanaerobaculia bacterium]|jgi:tetratricopeptide (TPR) repeat protein|nr:tetratricopeptide repeat protein [Thermoanaerobaculia bacterium]